MLSKRVVFYLVLCGAFRASHATQDYSECPGVGVCTCNKVYFAPLHYDTEMVCRDMGYVGELPPFRASTMFLDKVAFRYVLSF